MAAMIVLGMLAVVVSAILLWQWWTGAVAATERQPETPAAPRRSAGGAVFPVRPAPRPARRRAA